MATYRPRKHPNRPWHARARRDAREFSLGYYATKDEAVRVEADFDRTYPSTLRNHQRPSHRKDHV